MRPYLLFVSGITGIAGMSLAPAIGPVKALILAALFLSSYGFGQALTDCFQLDTDSLSAPYRPLVRGSIRASDVFTVSLIGLLLCGLVVSLYNPLNLLPAGLTVVGLATYTPFKRMWWSGPFYNAWIVGLLVVIGYLSAGGHLDRAAMSNTAFFGTLLTAFFGYANFVLAGYYKDISADRATGYRTLPVEFGMPRSCAASDLLALSTLVACGVAVVSTFDGTQSIPDLLVPSLIVAAGVVATVFAQLRLHRVNNEADAHRAIAPVVHSYILLLAGITMLSKPTWAGPLILLYVGFVVTMKLRPMDEQI
jgi:4-hydroxybenzoate polyprenyltransferase